MKLPENYPKRNSADALFELQMLRKNAEETHEYMTAAFSGMIGEAAEYQCFLEKTAYSRYMNIMDRMEADLLKLDTAGISDPDVISMTDTDRGTKHLLEDGYELL